MLGRTPSLFFSLAFFNQITWVMILKIQEFAQFFPHLLSLYSVISVKKEGKLSGMFQREHDRQDQKMPVKTLQIICFCFPCLNFNLNSTSSKGKTSTAHFKLKNLQQWPRWKSSRCIHKTARVHTLWMNTNRMHWTDSLTSQGRQGNNIDNRKLLWIREHKTKNCVVVNHRNELCNKK